MRKEAQKKQVLKEIVTFEQQITKSNKVGFNVNEIIKQLYQANEVSTIMSWGVSYFVGISEKKYFKFPATFSCLPQVKEENVNQKGLALKVDAYRFKGYVLITYNDSGFYDVDLISTRGNIRKQITDISLELLFSTIDVKIGGTKRYNN